MGSGGSKAHEAFPVTPAGAATAVADPPDDDPELPGHVADPLFQLHTLVVAGGDGEVAGCYEQLTSLCGLLLHEADDLDGPAAEELLGQVKAATVGWLGSLDDGQLVELAAAHGFEHPGLVGLHPTGTHPLVHWLDPAYPADLSSKAKIQAKATNRYQQLAAGATINGLTVADVDAADAHLGSGGSGPAPDGWSATPTDVAGLMAELTGQATGLPSAYADDYPAAAAALLEVERTLYAANCPALGDSLHQLQASAGGLVAAQLTATRPLAAHLIDAGLVPADAAWLAPSEALALARPATAAGEAADLTGLAAARAATVAELSARLADGWDDPAGLLPADPGGLPGWAAAAGQVADLKADVGGWASGCVQAPVAVGLAGNGWAQTAKHKALSTAFRAWAKPRKLAELRAAAGELGLAHAAKATRSQAQNFVAARWDPTLDAADIQAAVATKATAVAPTAPKTKAAVASKAAKTKAATKAKKTAGPPASVAAQAEAYLGTLSTLTAKLRAHRQLAADLPAPVPPATVAAHDWGTPTPFSKGSHTSSLHDGPDGNAWMFKPDTTMGARARAEAAASTVLRRVGIPGVDVHVAAIGDKVGSVQPLVTGAAPLTGGPSGWSQADVDQVVALHVAAWAVGDHDAHTSNVLRSPSGALFAVDQGQAFKFYGRDKLTSSWRPATNHGSPVYQTVYKAHSGGQLADGVKLRAKAALPVLKAFEAINDGAYRDMLRPAAVAGVKAKLAWVAPMRKAAAKRAGSATSVITDAQIVEEFLDYAVARKQRLRTDFAALYTQLGVDDADHLNWVA